MLFFTTKQKNKNYEIKMSRIVKFVKIIRNNWKKSVVGAALFSYGISYGHDYYHTNLLMRTYCKEAVKFGDEVLPATKKPRHITVILNPVAKKKSCKKLFEKYCEPLLHLAGIAVTIIQTEQEDQARSLIENLNTPTDAILVAGGDGTLLDVVTGLMRKYDNNLLHARQCPIGILPLGETNRLADSLFMNLSGEDLPQIREMADATMAAIRGETKFIDVVKIDPLEKNLGGKIKPIYALGIVEWGAWRDAYARKDKYWYWGNLRRYVTYIFNGYKSDINWDCSATIRYSDPCEGCSRCYNNNQSNKNSLSERRWWQVFIPKRQVYAQNEVDYSKIKNDKCGKFKEILITTTEITLATRNVTNSESKGPPSFELSLGPEYISYMDFVAEGWRRVKGKKNLIERTFDAMNLELLPNTSDNFNDKQHFFSIDNEEFEVKPVRIKLLPKAVKIFCL